MLQLALAAGESAIDLDSMSKGLSVVVIKSKDTWNLSVRGAINTVSSVIENTATTAITEGIERATQALNTGINKVLDASADTLDSAVESLSDTLDTAAKSKAQEVVDMVYTQVVSEVETALNTLQYEDLSDKSIEEVTGLIDSLFTEAENNVTNLLNEIRNNNKDNPVVAVIVGKLTEGAYSYKTVIFQMQDSLLVYIEDALDKADSTYTDIMDAINGCMTQVRYDVINKAQVAIDNTKNEVQNSIQDVKITISSSIEEWTNAKKGQVTEEVVEKVKGQIVSSLNSFSDKCLSPTKTNLGKADSTTDKSVASMIKFGYRDYLMLFLFASICVNDDDVLCRVGDLIQLNMSHATGNGEAGQLVFTHNKGDQFKLSEACTYVTVGTSVKTDMLFMKMDFFNRLVLDPAVDADTQIKGVSTLQYHGLGGY